MYKAESVLEKETYKIFLDFVFQMDQQIPVRRKELVNKLILPFGGPYIENERKRKDKYLDLARKLSVVKIGRKIATHLGANVSAYAPRARFIFDWKNMATQSELISQMVTYLHIGSHVKPRKVKMRIQMRAGRKEHKNNERRHSASFAFELDKNWLEEKQRSFWRDEEENYRIGKGGFG